MLFFIYTFSNDHSTAGVVSPFFFRFVVPRRLTAVEAHREPGNSIHQSVGDIFPRFTFCFFSYFIWFDLALFVQRINSHSFDTFTHTHTHKYTHIFFRCAPPPKKQTNNKKERESREHRVPYFLGALMFGLELVAVVPFCVAVWRLGQKVADQQHLIEQHEATITSQQEVLEKLSGVGADVPLGISGRTIALASVGVVACMTVNYTYRLSLLRRNVAPPSTYQPTAAAFEAEECVVCLTNKKDTFCAPCQHFAMCWPCSQNFLNKPCPICRKTIEFTQFTFDT